MKQIFLCLIVALLACAVAAVGTTMAYDPLFWIEEPQTTQLNMTITQWDETTMSWEVPVDSVYYIESPINIMVKYPGGANATNATINITGPGSTTHPELTTNATGQANYTFNYTEITRGGQQIVVKAVKPGAAYAQQNIYVDYQGILEVSVRTDSMVIDSDYGNYWNSDADMYYTVIVRDSATASKDPVEGVKVTMTHDANTNHVYMDEGTNPNKSCQIAYTDNDGEATFSVHSDSVTELEGTLFTITTERRGYMPDSATFNAPSDITVVPVKGAFATVVAFLVASRLARTRRTHKR
ncbi:MAG: hypothetical protein JW878_06125 [Methanomicrobia archaeon]|nr:hypothetical protein [Methanomicrobia archaeon]